MSSNARFFGLSGGDKLGEREHLAMPGLQPSHDRRIGRN
jgi:hypothetical protein